MKTLTRLLQIAVLGLFLPVLAYAGFSGGGGSYTLPPATTSTLGGVISDGSTVLVNASGVVSSPILPVSGTLSAGTLAGSDGTHIIPVSIGTNLAIASGVLNASGGGSMVYPGAGIPNSTGSAWGTSYTAGSGIGMIPVLDASGNLALNNWTLNYTAGSGTYPTIFGSVGSGSTVDSGWNFGVQASGYGCLWSTSVTAATTNCTVKSNGANSYLGGTSAAGLVVNNITMFSATSTTLNNNNGVWQGKALPTVTTTNCGGVAIAALNATGTHSINIVLGTTPTTATRIINMNATATHGWICTGPVITSGYATNAYRIARSAALSTTTFTLTKYNNSGGGNVPVNFATSDELDLSCGGV